MPGRWYLHLPLGAGSCAWPAESAFEPIGDLRLKNIARPVEAFALRLDPGVVVPLSRYRSSTARIGPPRRRLALASGSALLVCALIASAWWLARSPVISPSPAASVEPVPAVRPGIEVAATSNPTKPEL